MKYAISHAGRIWHKVWMFGELSFTPFCSSRDLQTRVYDPIVKIMPKDAKLCKKCFPKGSPHA